MELRVLRYFLTAAREENITRAAELLHITQPALSRQLAALEEELGSRLFERGRRKTTLTAAGLLLRRRAEEMLELERRTEKEFRSLGQELTGEIAIGSAESSAAGLLPGLLGGFSRQYPLVRYDLTAGNADQIKERLDRGLVDIGLLMEPVDIERYEFLRLGQTERWGVLAPAGDPLAEKGFATPDDLACLPLLMSHRNAVQGQLAGWFGSRFDQLHIFATMNLIGNAARFVEQHMGYACTIEGAVAAYDRTKFCFIPFSPTMLTRSVLVWKRFQTFSPATSRFIDYIKITLKHDER